MGVRCTTVRKQTFPFSDRDIRFYNSPFRDADCGKIDLMVDDAMMLVLCAETEVPCICSRAEGYYLFRRARQIGEREEGIDKGIESGRAGVGSCRDEVSDCGYT